MTTTNTIEHTYTDNSTHIEPTSIRTYSIDRVTTNMHIPTGEEFINLSVEEQNKYEKISFALFASEPNFLNE
ncbi:MAG: hypothetical protein HGA95_04470 [Caldiserica bacterium]|nr:hypothetical protein [Caldisericota bacterium]